MRRPPRILVLRAPHQASALATHLRALGADPILIPTIDLAPPTSFAALDQSLANLENFHWLLFTSANAVAAFAARLGPAILTGRSQPGPVSRSKDLPVPATPSSGSAPESRLPPHLKIAAIGPATAQALNALGLSPHLLAAQAVAESLAAALLPHARQPDGAPTQFLLIRAESARDVLPQTLRAAAAQVTIAPAYRTIIPPGSAPSLRTLFADPAHHPDAIVFTSASTVDNLFALLASAAFSLPPTILRASIGPMTSTALRSHNLPPQLQASTPSVEVLAQEVVKYLYLKYSL